MRQSNLAEIGLDPPVQLELVTSDTARRCWVMLHYPGLYRQIIVTEARLKKAKKVRGRNEVKGNEFILEHLWRCVGYRMNEVRQLIGASPSSLG